MTHWEFLPPAIIEPKQIIQLSWRRKIDWDDPLPLDLEIRWKNWLINLSKINHIYLPRWYGFSFVDISYIELQIFADALNSAFGTVAFFRYKKQDTVKCSFILSKWRLAPANSKTSIPMLELHAVVMATRLKVSLLEEIKENITKVFLWTDSKTVLNYLRNGDRNFGVFVAHRVNEIRSHTTFDDWYYVPTEENIADFTTRYQEFPRLINNKNWFYVPDFLQAFEFNTFDNSPVLQNNVMNIEDVNIITKSKYSGSSNEVEINWTYYSSLPKLVRHISWILKLKRSWMTWKRQGKETENFTQLNTKDTHNGLEKLIKISHHQSFPLEITNLLSQISINCNSKILSLSPFIDKKNILRVGGRLKNVHPDAKHQVILSRHHYLSKLIISDIHYKNAHIGREHTLCLLRNTVCNF